MTSPIQLSSTTRAVRAGIATDREHGAVVPPIHLSSTFAFEAFNRPRTFDYTRSGNPTRSQLASALAELEGGANAVVTSTGMSAVTLVLQLVKPGDVVVAAHDCYGGTQRLLRALAQRGHFDLRFLDLTRTAAEEDIAALRPRIVWVETPSNPLLRITDASSPAVIGQARRRGTATPNSNPHLQHAPVPRIPLHCWIRLSCFSRTPCPKPMARPMAAQLRMRRKIRTIGLVSSSTSAAGWPSARLVMSMFSVKIFSKSAVSESASSTG